MQQSRNMMASEAVARAFVDARREGRALPDFPGEQPASMADAYVVQDAALRLADGTVAGWKVGKIHPPVDGEERLTGPIFADQVFVDEGGEPLAMPVFAEGFAAAEAEFLLRIGTAPDPAKTSYTNEEARALIDAVHVGIEIASSPFPGINRLGPRVTVSDFGNNNGLIVGAEAQGWQDADLNDWTVTLSINGAEIGRATTATMLDGPWGAARYLFEHMASRGIALSPGQWISSGAVTGVHEVKPGDRVDTSFDGRFTLGCTIKAR